MQKLNKLFQYHTAALATVYTCLEACAKGLSKVVLFCPVRFSITCVDLHNVTFLLLYSLYHQGAAFTVH